MKLGSVTLVTAALALLGGTSGLALEKASVPVSLHDERDNWSAGAETVTVAYYNTCQGWTWTWGGWSNHDQTGTCFGPFDGGGLLLYNWMQILYSSPSGWGFTGTISIAAADSQCCPTQALSSVPWVPVSGWSLFNWFVQVPERFIVMVEWGTPSGFTALSRLHSDHPAAGPTGEAACGICYPTTRVTHSFRYGRAGQTLCPGSRLNDGVCDVEWLIDIAMSPPPAGVEDGFEEGSWGKIKTLYR